MLQFPLPFHPQNLLGHWQALLTPDERHQLRYRLLLASARTANQWQNFREAITTPLGSRLYLITMTSLSQQYGITFGKRPGQVYLPNVLTSADHDLDLAA